MQSYESELLLHNVNVCVVPAETIAFLQLSEGKESIPDTVDAKHQSRTFVSFLGNFTNFKTIRTICT